MDNKKPKTKQAGLDSAAWLKSLHAGLGLSQGAPKKMAAGGEAMSDTDLATLQDMFGKDSSSLGDALTGARQQALAETLGKTNLDDYEQLFGAEKSLVPMPPKQLPVPTQSEAGFQMMGEGNGAAPAAAAEGESGLPAVVEAGGTPGVIETTGTTLGSEAMPAAVEGAGPLAALSAGTGLALGKAAKYVGEGGLEADASDLWDRIKNGNRAYAGDIPLPAEDPSTDLGGRPGDRDDMVPVAAASEATKPPVATKKAAVSSAKKSSPATGSADMPPAPATPDSTSSAPAMNPILAKYLQDRQDMSDAQDVAAKNRLIAGIAGATGQLAASTYGATKPVDEAGFKTLEQNANAPVAALQAKQEAGLKGLQTQQTLLTTQQQMQENDPNSAISATTRKIYGPILAKMGMPPNALNGMSSADIKANLKDPSDFVAKMKQTEAQQAATHEMALARLEQSKQLRDVQLSEKQRVEDEKDAATLANKMNYLTASSRSALGSAANAKTSVARLIDIASRPDATNEDMQSVYGDLNRVVSNTTTMSGTEHQAYVNAQTKLAGLMSALSSNPVPADIPQIKQHIIDVAKGMDKISDNITEHNTRMLRAGHEGWIQRHPQQWQDMLAAQATNAPTTGAAAPGSAATIAPPPASGEVARLTKDGRTAIFDANTKQFLRYQ